MPARIGRAAPTVVSSPERTLRAAGRDGGGIDAASDRFDFVVHSYETDPHGWHTPASLCSFLQEAAWRNAERLGAGVARLQEHGFAWVLHRLKVELRAHLRHGDSVCVTTWPRGFESATALRDFEVTHARLGPVAFATSRWVVVDIAAHRVVRLPDFVRGIPAGEPLLLELGTGPLPTPPALAREKRFEVRRSDLDPVRHVNNTRFVEWALDAVPDETVEHYANKGFEIVFRREAIYGDAVVSRCGRLAVENGYAFVHALVRESDGQELVQAVSFWEPRGARAESAARTLPGA